MKAMADIRTQDSTWDSIIGVKNQVSDTTILTGLWISSVVGVAVTILFAVLQRASLLYKYRLVASHVRVKPPKLREHGLISLIDWAIKSISVSDVDFILSAGLDALIMVKMCALGVQLFLPLCILGLSVLLPLHWTGGASKQSDAYQSGFMRLTMANIPQGSHIFWVHVVFVYIYLAWAMFLLRWHYHQYLTIRQHYLRKGNDVNLWRALYEDQKQPLDGREKIRNLLLNVPLIKAFMPSFVPASAGSSTPAQGSDDEGDVYPRGGLAPADEAAWKSSPRDSLAPLGGVYSSLRPKDGLQFRAGCLSVTASREICTDAASNLTRRSLPHSGTQSSYVVTPRTAALDGPERILRRATQSFGSPRAAAAAGSDQTMRHVLQKQQLQLRYRSRRNPAPSFRELPAQSSELAEEPSAERIPLPESNSQGIEKAGQRESGSRRGTVAEATEGSQHDAEHDPEVAVAKTEITTAAAVAATSMAETGMTAVPHVDIVPERTQQLMCPPPPVLMPCNSSKLALSHEICGSTRLSQHDGNGSVALQVPCLDVGVTSLGSSVPAAGGTCLSGDCQDSASSESAMELDPDAHLLEWWLERRKMVVPLNGRTPLQTQWGQLEATLSQRASIEPDSGGEVQKSGLSDVDLTRPSVGHRKTVNAEDWDGRRVSVLAQHYAVLVTDVVERSPGEDMHSGKSGVQGDTPNATNGTVPYRSQASCLPRWLRSWCNLQYGKQAARKLNPKLSSTSFDDNFGSGVNHIAHNSRISCGLANQCSRVRGSLASTTFSSPKHSHSRSVGYPLSPPTTLLELGSVGARGDLGGDGAMPGTRSLSGLRAPASLYLAPSASNGRRAGGEGLLRLFEMMAQGAQEKLAAMGGMRTGGPGQMQESNHIGHVATTNDAAFAQSVQTATTPTPSASSGTAQLSQSLRSRSLGHGPAASGGDQVQRSKDRAVTMPGGAVALLPSSTAWEQLEYSRGNGIGACAVAEALELSEGRQGGGAAGGNGEGNQSGSGGGDDGATSDAAVSKADSGMKEDLVAGASVRRQQGVADAANPAELEGGKAASIGSPRAAVLARLEVVRQAVWSGRVAQLPWRYRYSVVSATFLRLFPEEFDRAIQVINFKTVDLLLMQVDRHMAQYEYAIKYEEQTGKKLFGRVGFCGLVGERRRLREYHLEKINTLLDKVRKARVEAANTAQTSSWIVFFSTQRAAAMASQCIIHAEDNRRFRVHPAPGPDEVNWSALWSNFRGRDLRRNLMRPLVVLMVVFPIGIFTGGLAQLDYLLCPSHNCAILQEGSDIWRSSNCTEATKKRENQQLSWDWYCGQKDPFSKLLKRLVVAWLPSLLLILWQGMVLPLFFTFVVQVSRQARSLSEADRLVAKNMFYFGIFNVFLGGVVGSTIIQGINSAIEKGPSEIFNLVGTYVPTSSNFFINYTMFRVFVSVPLRMLWPHIGIRMYLIRRYLRFSCIITQRERAFLMAPVSPRYGFEVGMVTIIFLIGFAFSVVSPLLLVMTVFFFVISWLFWRWSLLYVYVRKYEGGGTMWPFIFNRVMVCMAIFPVFTACVFITKHAYVQAIVLLVTFPIILIRFHKYCYYRFETGLKAMPLEATVAAPYARVGPWVYTPPPLLTNLAGWHPDWSKCWMGWNMPVMYG
ncbi:hypothetical protein VaNZ11_004639 [Volvox africanus]|uniref:ERD4-related membrane protein n=1 Tax=Volvox africanus TaxID=51714 RepID=A0ABQ5RWX7_9CHLO|nr:hypothetical protein VaNZ11_004639 [Volvox africanus]